MYLKLDNLFFGTKISKKIASEDNFAYTLRGFSELWKSMSYMVAYVATQLMCGGIFPNHFIANCPQNASVEEFSKKSVNI